MQHHHLTSNPCCYLFGSTQSVLIKLLVLGMKRGRLMYSVSLPQSSDERRMGWGNSTAESKISYVFGCVGSRCPTCINHYQTQKQAANATLVRTRSVLTLPQTTMALFVCFLLHRHTKRKEEFGNPLVVWNETGSCRIHLGGMRPPLRTHRTVNAIYRIFTPSSSRLTSVSCVASI